MQQSQVDTHILSTYVTLSAYECTHAADRAVNMSTAAAYAKSDL